MKSDVKMLPEAGYLSIKKSKNSDGELRSNRDVEDR